MKALTRSNRARRRSGGFSYVEVLIATAVIALLMVPALESLSTGIRGAALHVETVEGHFRTLGRLEELLAEPFEDLDDEAVAIGDPNVASTVYSDPGGTPLRRLVFLARYDGDDADADDDAFTGGDEGLVWIQVRLENAERGLETVTTP